MTSSQQVRTPLPVGSSVSPGTLRSALEQLRPQGGRVDIGEAVGILVPLTLDIAERHAAGEELFVHPSSALQTETGGYRISPELAAQPPSLPRDRSCLAPEERSGPACLRWEPCSTSS
jgi:hypothetical protein